MFTVDATPPRLTLDSPAAGALVADSTPVLRGTAGTALRDLADVTVTVSHGSDVVRTFDLRPSSSAWSVEVTPPLPDGVYTVSARQSDVAGNATRTPSREFTIDTMPPTVSIASGPASTTESREATFGLTKSDAGAVVECRLDGGAWRRCGASASYSALALGRHVFEARATDAAGNTGPVVGRAWTVRAPAAPTPSPAPQPTATPRATACMPALRVPRQHLAVVRRHGLAVTLRASRACRVRLTVKLGRTVLARRTVAAGTRSRHIVLALRHRRSLRRKLTVTATSPGARAVTRRITLRR
jgi:hypothetical protein